MVESNNIYTVGGTVQAGGGIYIKRKADDDLLELCKQGEFAFILSSRQVGKSSLMVRTAQQLEKENIRSVTIDLSAIGVNVTQDEWYLGILNEIHTALDLKSDIFAWWEQFSQLGPSQRLNNFFRDILLKEVKEQVVLFFDEIDSTLSIPFSDDFYVALRAVYNARSTVSDFKRLSFVLVGVAAPSDLISDNKRTPFNIGRRVEINDFTLAEALPLVEGLGQQAVQILTWVFQYTNGHPYLTQRLCAYLATIKESLTEEEIAIAVEKLFTGEQGKQDNNLQFVRDMLSKRSPDVTKVLLVYRDIRSGRRVVDDERSITKAHLKLSGLIRSEKGVLQVRNEIYNTVFNVHWIQDNIPKNWQKIALVSLSVILGVLVLGTLAVFINDFFVGSRVDNHFRNFISAGSPRQRLADLAEIYRQKGILSNRDSGLTASQLFYGLSTAEDQLALFRFYGWPDDRREKLAMQDDLVVVISHLYITVANVDPEEDNTELLQAMFNALNGITENPNATKIQESLKAWIDARKNVSAGDYQKALENYNLALSKDAGNHAMLYERAKVFVALGQYQDALKDLDATIAAAKQAAVPDVGTPTPTASSVPATVNATQVQTDGTAIPTTAVQPTQQGDNPSVTAAVTPAIGFTQIPTSVPTNSPVYTLPPKYESNFTTLIDIINAVQAVIRNSVQLQIALQSTLEGTYTNLRSSGLISSTQVSPIGLLADIIKRGYILVATDPNYEPQSFLNTSGVRPANTKCPGDALTMAEMQGFDVDVAIALGDSLGVETCFATPSWDVITGGSWADKWDISIGSMTITTERQKILDFSVPYYYIPAVFAVRSNSGISSMDGLSGQAICVGIATTYETWLNNGDTGLPASSIYALPPAKITVVPLDTDQECAQAIASGRNDFVGYLTSSEIVDANIASGIPIIKIDPPVLAEQLAAAFDKSSSLNTDGLRSEVDKLFSTMHNNGKLTELSQKWFNADLSQVPDLTSISDQVVLSTSTPIITTENNGLININTATAAEIETLPGIGPTLAQRIVDFRVANGPFITPDDLLKVNGIGPSTYELIKNLITVEASAITSIPTPVPLPTFSFDTPTLSVSELPTFSFVATQVQVSSSQYFEYLVQEGDTLADISTKCGYPIANLIELNNITDANSIRVGQIIKLPGDSPFLNAACTPLRYPATATP